MPRKTYQKLVRDRIPEIIQKKGGLPAFVKLDDDAFRIALKRKLLEEANELIEAVSREDVLGELADVLQLVESIAADHGLSFQEVETHKEAKKQERGAFTEQVFLEHVDET